jgi:hypothetical protein
MQQTIKWSNDKKERNKEMSKSAATTIQQLPLYKNIKIKYTPATISFLIRERR